MTELKEFIIKILSKFNIGHFVVAAYVMGWMSIIVIVGILSFLAGWFLKGIL